MKVLNKEDEVVDITEMSDKDFLVIVATKLSEFKEHTSSPEVLDYMIDRLNKIAT